jgi:hypothetical protein
MTNKKMYQEISLLVLRIKTLGRHGKIRRWVERKQNGFPPPLTEEVRSENCVVG